jgi:hypothetical protein
MRNPSRSAGVPAFFKPAMLALHFGEPRPQALGQLSDSAWRKLLAFGDLAHLTLPLVLRSDAGVPAWVQQRVAQNLVDNRERRLRIAGAYREIALAFDDNRVDHLVFKGFAQYPDFVPAPDTRMQSDIDIYCPRTMIPAAQAALQRLGYIGNRALEKYPADHLPEMTRRGSWRWRGNFYDPEMPPAVDLHYCLWNESTTRVAVDGIHEFWDRREMREGAGFQFPGLCTVDSLAFSALHILRDLMRGDWVLHHVFEMAYFMNNSAEDNSLWDKRSQIHDRRMRSLQAVSFQLARLWFGCRCSAAVEDEIEQLSTPVKQWLERFSESPLTGMFAPNKHGLWLHLALLPITKDKLLIVGNTLLPLRLPRPGADGQAATKTRRLRRFWPSQKHIRYVLHVIFRSAFHLKMIPDTLWRGLGWWLAQRQSGRTA